MPFALKSLFVNRGKAFAIFGGLDVKIGAITDVPGISVGHYTNAAAATGCTVVLCEDGAVGGVDARGSAPGTRETDLLRPTALVNQVHAVLLSGGSAFGLDAAAGVMRRLEERGVGLQFGGAVIPIVPAAILFDLSVIRGDVRPAAAEGYAACLNASSDGVTEGSVGAGTGATVAKLLGMRRAVKGGIGSAALDLGDGVIVGAIAAVNAVGGVYEHSAGRIIAGPRSEHDGAMLDALELIASPAYAASRRVPPSNTTIGVVATNARLTKAQANKLASAAQDGVALAVRPAHLMSDGDTMFALATGKSDSEFDMNRLIAAAAICVSSAIARGVETAETLGGIPSANDVRQSALTASEESSAQ